MIQVKNVQTITGQTINHTIQSKEDTTIDATGLTLLPALIDPHVHFRVPGWEHKEDWRHGAQAAIAGGVTTVFDMPSGIPSCTTFERFYEKESLINQQLQEVGIPLHYRLYLGADKESFGEIKQTKNKCIGIKVFLGSSIGNLLIDNISDFEKICVLSAEYHLVVAVHGEDDATLKQTKKIRVERSNAPIVVTEHSILRPREAAITAVKNAIRMSEQHGTRMYLLHMTTREEVALVREAKQRGLPVFAEITPHHLFLNDSAYEKLGTFAQMNPPLRTKEDQEALWEGVRNGTIDTIGTDHAPHTREEKAQPYGKAPSGVPGIETMLPLLLTAYHEGKITLKKIVELTHENPQKIFGLEPNDDVVLVNLNKKKTVRNEELKTKCGWSPFNGWELTGWPVYTVCKGRVFKLKTD
ncbi:MAG: dihydroorotase [Patescibacteria group bacterium]